MRFCKSRVGDRLVFGTELGVWEKISDTAAKLIFGDKKLLGKEREPDGNEYVYVVSADRLNGEPNYSGNVRPGTVRVFLVYDDQRLMSYNILTEEAAVLASVDYVLVEVGKKTRSYTVFDRGYHMDKRVLLLEVDSPTGEEVKNERPGKKR